MKYNFKLLATFGLLANVLQAYGFEVMNVGPVTVKLTPGMTLQQQKQALLKGIKQVQQNTLDRIYQGAISEGGPATDLPVSDMATPMYRTGSAQWKQQQQRQQQQDPAVLRACASTSPTDIAPGDSNQTANQAPRSKPNRSPGC